MLKPACGQGQKQAGNEGVNQWLTLESKSCCGAAMLAGTRGTGETQVGQGREERWLLPGSTGSFRLEACHLAPLLPHRRNALTQEEAKVMASALAAGNCSAAQGAHSSASPPASGPWPVQVTCSSGAPPIIFSAACLGA